MAKTLLITPPFTQLNTPYPATMYLKGFLEEHHVPTEQCDLSIELFTAIFNQTFITQVFEEAAYLDEIAHHEVWSQREDYIAKVDMVIQYLQHHEVTAAYQICRSGFLPAGHRSDFDEEEFEWAFGSLGILDKAKHIATIFVEELGDFIQANIDEFFSFTRYAEQIASSASNFDQLEEFLQYDPTMIEDQMLLLLSGKIAIHQPKLVCFSVPFPGNLFSALRCSQYLRINHPDIKVAMGGGYCNTELRSLSDPRVFDYVDFISLDDGEGPLLRITELLDGKIDASQLERTYICDKNKVKYLNKSPNTIFHHKDLPAPSYAGLKHDTYLSFLDVMNPMHRLWSDGKWNKLTISHGCYWKQCSFCDVSLDYIGTYQNTTADALVDKIEAIVKETGTTGFHFVDEAAPPKMLKALAEKLLERNVFITWWTNIRFEKTFTSELCELLARSGCIAVTGGLEVASDRLLAKMKKGVDIEQVARVTAAFSDHSIMVHAYLMYGFPTETAQETVDSLEVVRQLFENGCIQSAFWHTFTTTKHSPIGLNPAEYDITITGPKFEGFAENDLTHDDPLGADHEQFKGGLKLALSNYLNGQGLDESLQSWFDFPVDVTTVDADKIASALTAG